MFAALLLASCGQDDDMGLGPTQPDDPQKIRFEMVHATATAVQADSGTPQTRVATSTDGEYNSEWSYDDEVGVFIVKGNGGLQASGNWVDNMKMTYEIYTGWKYTLPAGKELYPVDEELHFYAYFPYQDGVNPLDMTFAVKADQNRNNGSDYSFSENYLMTATTTGVKNSSAPVQLTFAHRMAMVELTVSSGENPGSIMNSGATLILKGCKLDTSLDLSTGNISTTGTATDIVMQRIEKSNTANYNTDFTYRALVPAQEITGGAELFHVKSGDCVLKHKPATDFALTAGQVKPYSLTIKADEPDPDHAYAIGDIYPHTGLPMGVVFDISNGGKSGKIVSLYDGYGGWGPTGVTTGASNDNDGLANMATIKGLDNDFSDYPAFSWIDALNPAGTAYSAGTKVIWYLPAKDELLTLHGQLATVNTSLTANGWSTLRTNGNYWSSTEYADHHAWHVVFQSGAANQNPKFYDFNVLAVLAF